MAPSEICLWGKRGIELLFGFMITEHNMWNPCVTVWPWVGAYVLFSLAWVFKSKLTISTGLTSY